MVIVRGTAATCGYAQLEQELELRAQSEGDAVHLLLAQSRAQRAARSVRSRRARESRGAVLEPDGHLEHAPLRRRLLVEP